MKLQCNDCIHKNVCKNIEKWKAYNLEMEEMKEKYPVDWVENNKPFSSCSDYKRDILIGDNNNKYNTKNSNDKISNIDKEKQKVTEYYNNFNNVDNILDDMLAYLLK